MKIEIISDTVCPWCYIGKRRLEKALARRPDIDAEINWHPFQLNPEMPAEGRDHKEYYAEKFGSAERVAELVATMTRAGAEEGLDFQFDGIAKSPNTLASHRLIRWAGSAACQDEIVEALFRAYFSEAKDIGDHSVLIEIAAAAGMDSGRVEKLFAGGRDIDLVARDVAGARQMGISGVPFFNFDFKYGVSGAQSPEVFLEVIDKLLAGDDESEAGSIAEGGTP